MAEHHIRRQLLVFRWVVQPCCANVTMEEVGSQPLTRYLNHAVRSTLVTGPKKVHNPLQDRLSASVAAYRILAGVGVVERRGGHPPATGVM